MKRTLFILTLLLITLSQAYGSIYTEDTTVVIWSGEAYWYNDTTVFTHSGKTGKKTATGKDIKVWCKLKTPGSEMCAVNPMFEEKMLKRRDTINLSTLTDTVIELRTDNTSMETYEWFALNKDNLALDNSNMSNISDPEAKSISLTVHPKDTAVYVIKTTFEDENEMVFNGDFEEAAKHGNIGFTSDFTYKPKPDPNGSGGFGWGVYSIGVSQKGDPDYWCPSEFNAPGWNYPPQTGDHFFFGDGQQKSGGQTFYSVTFTVEPYTTYRFRAKFANLNSSGTYTNPGKDYAIFGFFVKNKSVKPTYDTLKAGWGVWEDLYVDVTTEDDTLITLDVKNFGVSQNGNDFCFDDVSFLKYCLNYDTIVVINDITIRKDISADICEGETYHFNDILAEEQGIYIDTLQTDVGIDSIVTLHLNVNPVYEVNLDTTICEQQSIDFNGQRLYAAGVYTAVLPTMDGCDSVVHIKVNVSEKSYKTIDTTIYAWVTYNFIDSLINDDGTYVKILPNAAGCDSVITLNLRYDDKIYINRIMCEGETYQLGSRTLTSTGVYSDTLTALNGNDSIIVLSLTVYPNYNDTIFAKIGAGTVYERDGFYESTSGIYEHDSKTVNGCDSLVVLVLEAEDPIDIWAPNAIIPNGDGGENRVFKVYPSSEDIVIESLQIYNRWGGLIFETEDINKGWDGKYKGSVCQNGTYIYTVNYYRKGKEGKKYRKTGEVNIVG
ncbi:MAG: gliding motility-associated C-terminal domain-containing protein [Bacteroidales bacterium]|nr:gliding motility-associated C-terminal domain-containing protein [Bacteroidales bacterium]